jgi:hypothetical protein
MLISLESGPHGWFLYLLSYAFYRESSKLSIVVSLAFAGIYHRSGTETRNSLWVEQKLSTPEFDCA